MNYIQWREKEKQMTNCNIIDGLSMDLEQANIDKLKAVFPQCFAEGKLDIDKLLSLCGGVYR